MAVFRSAAIVITLGFFAFAYAVAAMPRVEAADEMPRKSGQVTSGRYDVTEAQDVSWRAARQPHYQPSQYVRSQVATNVSQHAGTTRHWYSYAPTARHGPKPLILLFHGANRNGLSMVEMWKRTADRNGLLLVAPDAHLGHWPVHDPNPSFLNQLIAETAEEHDVDLDRIYLFGHSAGAGYAQVLLNRALGPWKSAAAHAGLMSPEFFQPASDPKSFRLYLGSRDHFYPLARTKETLAEYAQIGHDTSLVVIENHNHWFYEIGPDIAESSWRWFQSTY